MAALGACAGLQSALAGSRPRPLPADPTPSLSRARSGPRKPPLALGGLLRFKGLWTPFQAALDTFPRRSLPRQLASDRVAPGLRGNSRGGMQSQHDYAELEYAFSTFTEPGQVFEVRLLHHNRKRVDAGYFDHPSHAATAIAALQEQYAGIYFTPNPVAPDLAARSYNRISSWMQLTTMDNHILRRKWLLIDIDPDRPSGISSTEAELQNAFKVACTIKNMLEFEYGWSPPYVNVSGNGAHVLYHIDEPNTEEVRDAVANFLKTLNGRFKADGCSVDTTTFNASRIFRVPGTWARKGDNIPTRPHRKAYVVAQGFSRLPVTLAQIQRFNTLNAKYLPKAATREGPTKSRNEYPDDEKVYRGLNEHAMNRVKEWVPVYFPAAREYKEGYRVASADLGLDFEEDLTIHPWPLGIKYFGVADQGDITEGRRTPISLIAELVFAGDKPKAARALADTLKVPLSEFDILSSAGLDHGINPDNLPGTTSSQPVYDFRRVPSMADLQKRTFKEPKWVIQNVLPTGTILLAARPKMRKTFLALQLGLAVCAGRKFLDWKCDQADVLFLGLEDNERRLRSRIKLLQTFDLSPPDLSGFRYWTGGVDISPTTGKEYVSDPDEAARTYAAFPRGQAGVDALGKFLDVFPRTRLIVIDTYAHFRDQSNNRDVYQRDVDQMMPITRLAAQREVCIIVVHHEKKGLASQESGDFMEDASGTSGITGTVDGVMSIKGKRGIQQENEERVLLLSGRDIPHDITLDMAFDAERGGWQQAARQDVRHSILKLLERHPYMTQPEFVSVLPNVSQSRIRQVLTTMKFENLIVQGRAGYSLPRDFKGDM